MVFDIDKAMPFVGNSLYGRLRRDCGADWDAYVNHRFVKQLSAGTLEREEFLAWMVQDYLYLVSYTRAYALLIYKSDTVARMRSAATIVHGLLNEEMSLHRKQLTAAGFTETDLDRTQETLETIAYGRFVLDRAQSGDALDLVVTLSACLAGYGEIGLRLLADEATLIEGNPYADWIKTYGGEGYCGLVSEGLAGLEALAQQYGGDARYPMLLDEFRTAVRLEAAFWDAGRSALTAA